MQIHYQILPKRGAITNSLLIPCSRALNTNPLPNPYERGAITNFLLVLSQGRVVLIPYQILTKGGDYEVFTESLLGAKY